MGKVVEVTVKVAIVAPDTDGDTPANGAADLEELREAVEAAIADIGDFDVDAAEHPDGVECWTIDEATVVNIEDK